jgi:hypothetical protein
MIGVKQRRAPFQFFGGPTEESEERTGALAQPQTAQGVQGEASPQLLRPQVTTTFTRGEEDQGVEAAASAGRTRLAHALMEKAQQSGEQIGSPWDALSNVAATLSDAERRRREEEEIMKRGLR